MVVGVDGWNGAGTRLPTVAEANRTPRLGKVKSGLTGGRTEGPPPRHRVPEPGP